MYYVYILRSQKDAQLYIGYTKDLKRRYKEHLMGESKSTSSRLPMILIFYEAYVSKKDAYRREKYFKTTKGKRALKIMLKNTFFMDEMHHI